jgi:hypothetical protein
MEFTVLLDRMKELYMEEISKRDEKIKELDEVILKKDKEIEGLKMDKLEKERKYNEEMEWYKKEIKKLGNQVNHLIDRMGACTREELDKMYNWYF